MKKNVTQSSLNKAGKPKIWEVLNFSLGELILVIHSFINVSVNFNSYKQMYIFQTFIQKFIVIVFDKRILLSFFIFIAINSQAQTILYVSTGCVVDDAEIGQTHYVFKSSDEADRVIEKIMEATDMKPNFVIKSGDVRSIIATEENNLRFIIYNAAYVERITHSAGGDWPATYLFAHEIAHHLNGHIFEDIGPEKSKEQELKADWFAGGILFRLGATLDQAKQVIGLNFNKKGSKSDLPNRERLEAITSGWKKKAEESGGLQPEHWFKNYQTDTLKSNLNCVYKDSLVGNFVLVKGGTFSMGCSTEQQDCKDDEFPVHQVTISDYYIGETEVTQAQWESIMGSNPSNFPYCDKCPVENISWFDIQDFLLKLNTHIGANSYRLPTEAEWEYAAQGGSLSKGFKYSGGNIIDDVAWLDCSKTRPVKMKECNELGLFDMSGNVCEWCSDWYEKKYSDVEITSQSLYTGTHRVIRGGSWKDTPSGCRVTSRNHDLPNTREFNLGFRLVIIK